MVEYHPISTRDQSRHACVVDADESTRPRPGGAVHKHHQVHINEKGMNSLNHCSLVHKFIPMLKGGSGEGMGKIGENPGMAADESQKQERSDRRSKE